MSKADQIFKEMCEDVISNGVSSKGQIVRPKWADGEPAHTIKKFAIVNRYNLQQEFPLLTFRKTNYKAAIDEILWIYQKKSNDVNKLNSKIWDSWADESGSIGKAYGYQAGVKHKYKEGEFDQIDRVLYDLKNNPFSRRIIINLYNHHDLNEMNLYPCAYSFTLNVTLDQDNNKVLNGILNQRSQDILVANNWNVVQYSVLLHMLAQVSDMKVGEFVHVIADAHIYDRHLDMVKELIGREQYMAPKFIINKNVKNFYDFTVDDFEVEDYKYGKQLKMEVAV